MSREKENRPSSVQEIMNHSFFKRVNWENIRERKVTPPWIPSLMNHFSKKLTSIEILNNQISPKDNPQICLDSRASIYFEKDHGNNENETSIYFVNKGEHPHAAEESVISKNTLHSGYFSRNTNH